MMSSKVGDAVEKKIEYKCTDCDVTDVQCSGESVMASGLVSVAKDSKTISLKFSSFEDDNACVYRGFFTKNTKLYTNVIAVIEKVTVTPPAPMPSPELEKQMEVEIPIKCEDCTLDTVSVNGIGLEAALAVEADLTIAPDIYYTVTPTSVTVHITQFSATFEGVYQAVFEIKGEHVTKTILDIRNPNDKADVIIENASNDSGALTSDGNQASTTNMSDLTTGNATS
ncbi:hypothetical protein evm_008924 [Chilo suppressalis]|nr:hypothetical protein evm_008924 [Chilo suppressalis]